MHGTIHPGAPYTTQVAITDPALFAADALKKALQRRAIVVEAEIGTHANPYINSSDTEDLPAGMKMHATKPPAAVEEEEDRRMCTAVPGACRIVAEHTSPPLADDVVWTLKVSQNLHAEMMLRRLAQGYGSDATAAAGTWVLRQFLLEAGLDGGDFVFYDGSGLSSHDLVTPRLTAKLLAYASTQPWFAQWKAALPVGGEDGSLARRFPKAPLKDHVFAKTGTLGESRALSGYVDCASGKTVIFSIMVDTHTPVNSSDSAAMDAIVAAIAETN